LLESNQKEAVCIINTEQGHQKKDIFALGAVGCQFDLEFIWMQRLAKQKMP